MIDALEKVRNAVRHDRIETAWRDPIEQLVERRLVVNYEGRFMSLMTEPAIGEQLLSERRERLAARRRNESRRRLPKVAV